MNNSASAVTCDKRLLQPPGRKSEERLVIDKSNYRAQLCQSKAVSTAGICWFGVLAGEQLREAMNK